jgi:hypothetical protein
MGTAAAVVAARRAQDLRCAVLGLAACAGGPAVKGTGISLVTGESVQVSASVEDLGRHLDQSAEFILRQQDRIEALEAALRDFDAWSNGYLDPRTGMGSGLHAEKWPPLSPGALREMRRIARHALNGGRR